MAGDPQQPHDPNAGPPSEPPPDGEGAAELVAPQSPDDAAARRQALLNRISGGHAPVPGDAAPVPGDAAPVPAVNPGLTPGHRALLDRIAAQSDQVQSGAVDTPEIARAPVPGLAPDARVAAGAPRPVRVEQPPAGAPAAAAQPRAEQAETQAERYARITEEINRRPSVRVTPEQDVVAVTVGEDEEFTLPYPEALPNRNATVSNAFKR